MGIHIDLAISKVNARKSHVFDVSKRRKVHPAQCPADSMPRLTSVDLLKANPAPIYTRGIARPHWCHTPVPCVPSRLTRPTLPIPRSVCWLPHLRVVLLGNPQEVFLAAAMFSPTKSPGSWINYWWAAGQPIGCSQASQHMPLITPPTPSRCRRPTTSMIFSAVSFSFKAAASSC